MEEDSRTPPLPRRDPGASALRAPPPAGVPSLPRRQPGASGRQAAGPRQPLGSVVPPDDETPTVPQPAIRVPVPAVSPPGTQDAPGTASETGAPVGSGPVGSGPVGSVPVAGAPAARRRPLRRRWVLAGLVVVILAGLLAGTWVSGLASRDEHTTSRGPAGGSAAFAAEARDRASAAGWVARWISRTTVVSCDAPMCSALRAIGWPPAELLVLRSPGGNPLASGVIIATVTLRGELGGRLESQYAPAVLARFGSGALRVEVRVIAPHGAAAYESALRADQADRKETGAVLLRSGRLQAPAAVRDQLVAGQVDARLLITLAGMAAQHTVRIDSFGGLGPGADSGMPFLAADLSETGRSAAAQASELASVLRYLHSQHGQYAGAVAQLIRQPGRSQPVLRIAFPGPSPLGLLGPRAS